MCKNANVVIKERAVSRGKCGRIAKVLNALKRRFPVYPQLGSGHNRDKAPHDCGHLIAVGAVMKSGIVKRRFEIAGRRASVSVEDAFSNGLREIAERRHESLSRLIRNIDAGRRHGNLSSACRLYVLRDYQQRTMLFGSGDQVTSAPVSDLAPGAHRLDRSR